MTILDLSAYNSIYIVNFVKIDIPNYSVLRFSDYYRAYPVEESNGFFYNYVNLGNLLAISDTTASIRANSQDLTLTLSGVPNASIAEVLNTEIKGSRIEVRRGYFSINHQVISSPKIKFKGIVNNFNINEVWPDAESNRVGTCSIGLLCSPLLDVLSSKKTGRRTNPLDEKLLYPTDLSMDRVPNITGANYNFGAPA